MSDETAAQGLKEVVKSAAKDDALAKLRSKLARFAVRAFADAGRELHLHGHLSSVSGSWRENPRKGVQVGRACADT